MKRAAETDFHCPPGRHPICEGASCYCASVSPTEKRDFWVPPPPEENKEKRAEALECIPPGQPFPETCAGFWNGCTFCPTEEEENKEQVKRSAEADFFCPPGRHAVCDDTECFCVPISPTEKQNDIIVSRSEDTPCLLCNKDNCVPCPPDVETVEKRGFWGLPPPEVNKEEEDKEQVKRDEDIVCIPPGQVCDDGPDCVHCPVEEEEVKQQVKRDQLFHPCRVTCDSQGHCHVTGDCGVPGKLLARDTVERSFGGPCWHCVGDECSCEDEEEKQVEKEKEKRAVPCIPHCVGEHCHCEGDEE